MSVMNVKSSTKAFGPNQVSTSNVTPQSTMPAEYTPEQMKSLGSDNVGEALNKIADTNWVDPSKKMRTVGNDKLDKDAFFKLMLAQMKNQDPTNPLKSHEMAAQLANFSSLEQMQNMNKTLTEMKNGQKPAEQFQVLNLIGKSVAGDSAQIVRVKGDKDHDLRFKLPATPQEVKIQVKNADGEVVRSYTLKNLKMGDQRLTWNGEDDKGNTVPAGTYRFSIEALAKNNQKMAVKTDFDGVITGVNYTPEGPVLLVGQQTIRMSDVKKITDPSLKKNDQNSTPIPQQDLKTQNQITDTKREGAPEAEKPKDILNNVSLSQGMLTKLNKEVGP